jgi:hypothetical protein
VIPLFLSPSLPLNHRPPQPPPSPSLHRSETTPHQDSQTPSRHKTEGRVRLGRGSRLVSVVVCVRWCWGCDKGHLDLWVVVWYGVVISWGGLMRGTEKMK